MAMTWRDAERRAVELGAVLEGGINWTWAKGFRTPEDGKAFVAWCDANGIDNRGYYEAMPEGSNPNFHVDGVRFR